MVMLRIILLWALFSLSAHAASLQATVDRNPISENETLQLTLTLRDYDGPANPDLTALEGLFDILGSTQSSQMSIINGRVDARKEVHISLAPKQVGNLVIPTIRIGNLESQPITLKVVKANAPQQGGITDIALEVEVDNQAPYLQQQVILTVKLKHAVNLAEGVLPDPEIPGVEVYKLGDDKGYQMIQNGRRIGVIERQYALLPQQSGEVTIPSILFRGRTQERGAGSFGGLFNSPFNQGRQLQTRSQPIALQVKPQPQRQSGMAWLPASKLSLDESWSPTSANGEPQFRVGEPITRTLTLRAEGLSANQLPELSLHPQSGFKVYPDQPQLETGTNQQGVVGTRIEKYAIVPTQAGTLTLPAITLPWWNSQSGKLEMIKLAEKTVQIAPAAAGSAPSPMPQTEVAASPMQPGAASASPLLWPWQLATLLLAIAWLFTLWLWWRKQPLPSAKPDHSATLGKANLNTIKKACQANQSAQARNALLNWSHTHNPTSPAKNLVELAKQLNEEEAKQAIYQLDASLYKDGKEWDGSACWQAIAPALKHAKQNASAAHVNEKGLQLY